MTDIEKSLPINDTSSGLNTAIDDEAYLMTMVEDSLLPSNMTFTGLFEGDTDFHPDELSDFAVLLAPQVSDDDTTTAAQGGGTVSSQSSVTDAPVIPTSKAVVAAAAAAAVASLPVLPKLKEVIPSAAVVSPAGSQKRSFVLEDAMAAAAQPPLKKTKGAKKTEKTRKVAKTAVPSIPSLSKTKSADQATLPTLAPKPADLPAATPAPITLRSAMVICNNDNQENNDTKPTPAGAAVSKAKAVAKPAEPAKPLSEEERAKQCRDRNRQHARNTRLRKKAYVEELKCQLRDMVDRRDAALLEESQKAKIVEQQREVRFQVMQDFLQLRGRNEGNPQRWAAILEDGFSLTLPKTTFQTMVAPSQEAPTDVQVLDGVETIMADSTYFAAFLQTLGTRTHNHTTTTPGNDTSIPVTTITTTITFVYQCERSNFLMDSCNAIMNWTATSSGAVKSGARRELELSGTMRARFCAQTNRLEKAEIRFDTGIVHSQLAI